MTLDQRFAEARDAVDDDRLRIVPTPLTVVRARSRRRRVIGLGFGVVLIVVASAAVVVGVRSGSSPRRLDTNQPTTDSTALVSPVPFGNGLLFVPGAWGTDAVVTAADGMVDVANGPWSASIVDVGQATHTGTSAAYTDPLTTVDRVGPLSPPVAITGQPDQVVVTGDVGGRRVQVRSHGVDARWATQLLRSVTPQADRLPIRPFSVPATVGTDYAAATATLEAAGLRVRWTLDLGVSAPIGQVVSTVPQAGMSVSGDSVVVLHVAAPLVDPGQTQTRFRSVASGDPAVRTPGYVDFSTPLPTGLVTPGSANDPLDGAAYDAPIVFLRGELVGMFGVGDPRFDGSASLIDLTNPAWRPDPQSLGGPSTTWLGPNATNPATTDQAPTADASRTSDTGGPTSTRPDPNGPVAVTGEHIGDIADPAGVLTTPAPAWVAVVNHDHVVIGYTKTSEDFVPPVSVGDNPPTEISQAIYGEDGQVIGHFVDGQPHINGT